MTCLGLSGRTLLLAAVLAGQGESRTTVDLQTLEIRARGLPAQFAAYALWHGVPYGTTPELRAALSEAFDYATRAPEEFPRVSSGPIDSVEFREATASQLGLSRMALQTAV